MDVRELVVCDVVEVNGGGVAVCVGAVFVVGKAGDGGGADVRVRAVEVEWVDLVLSLSQGWVRGRGRGGSRRGKRSGGQRMSGRPAAARYRLAKISRRQGVK